MITAKIEATTPPPALTRVKENGDDNNTELFTSFKHKGIYHEIECKSSPGKYKCHFLSSEFGESIFERDSENFIASTKEMTEEYLAFLKRIIKVWKKQFPDF